MMSSPESSVATVEEQIRVRPNGSTREPAHKLVRALETDEATRRGDTPFVVARASDSALRPTRAVRSDAAAARLLVLLHASPLLGVAGAIALYWSSDGPRDVMFAVGMLLLLGAVAAFQQLRSRLVARLALPALREGVPSRQAHQDAELAADKLIRASYLSSSLARGGTARFDLSHTEDPRAATTHGCLGADSSASRWPPISLS